MSWRLQDKSFMPKNVNVIYNKPIINSKLNGKKIESQTKQRQFPKLNANVSGSKIKNG